MNSPKVADNVTTPNRETNARASDVSETAPESRRDGGAATGARRGGGGRGRGRPPAPRRGGGPAAGARRVVLEDLHAYYGDTHAVSGVSLSYEPGQVTAMIGPSGCGKSTLVRCINRMHEEIPG